MNKQQADVLHKIDKRLAIVEVQSREIKQSLSNVESQLDRLKLKVAASASSIAILVTLIVKLLFK